jgi:hypothetical protein
MLADTFRAAAKSVAGIGLPKAVQRTTRARVFFCASLSHIRCYGGLGGSPFGGAGTVRPVRPILLSSPPVRLVSPVGVF